MELFTQIFEHTQAPLIVVMLMVAVYWLVKRDDKQREEMKQNNIERENKLMEMNREIVKSHENCNDKYLAVVKQMNDAIDNNTQALRDLRDHIKNK